MEPIAPGISNLNLLSTSTEEVLPEENPRLMSTLDQFMVISDEMKIPYNDIIDQAVTSKKAITRDDVEAMYSASISSYIKANVDQALHNRPFQLMEDLPDILTTSSILASTCTCMEKQPDITKDEMDAMYTIETIKYVKLVINRFFTGRNIVPKYLDAECTGRMDAMYTIETVKWDVTPEVTFLEIGNRMTFAQYFNPNKEHVECEVQKLKFKGLEITDLKQPMLLCRKIGEVGPEPILLVPELCWPSYHYVSDW